MEGNTSKVDVVIRIKIVIECIKLSVDSSRVGTVQVVANYLAETVPGGVNAFRISFTHA